MKRPRHSDRQLLLAGDFSQHRIVNVIDSMTMSAPAPGVKLVGGKTNQQAREKQPNDDHYRSRFPPRVSASFGGY
jgi:hydrogenase maturation factor